MPAQGKGVDAAGPAAAILGIGGHDVSADERALISEADPWGFILFSRNIDTPEQVRRLTEQLRDLLGREAPILIDQEGGRVARLRPPQWIGWTPLLDMLDRLEATDRADRTEEAVWLRYRSIAHELMALGIDVDCMPLLDVPQPDAHPVIGQRALGRDPAQIARLGRVVCDALLAGGVLPVVKHLPGHGRATVDSHHALPRVATERDELASCDFAAFVPLADQPMGMTAHIVFDAIDAEEPATLSPACIRLIREEIGFGGLLMTDDLSMHALEGPFADRARKAIAAGCDVLLHCNADMAEMEAILAETPRLDGAALVRAKAAEAARRAPAPFDPDDALRQYRALTGE